MKKIIMAITATAITAVAAHSNVSAQNFLGSAAADAVDVPSFDSALTPGGYSINDLSTVNVHALKGFVKEFKNVNASWYKANDGGFIASFKTGDVKNSVAYTAKGTWHHTIRYYDEKQLPKDVRSTVKSTYYDYTILGVSEVHYEDQVIYIILIQDDTTIKTLRVCDGEMEEIKNQIRG